MSGDKFWVDCSVETSQGKVFDERLLLRYSNDSSVKPMF